MPTTFASLKKGRESTLDKLAKEMAAAAKTKRQKDERFWEPTVDKAKNGAAVIRFLPAPDGEDVPFVRLWHHGFKGPGGWYFENSRTTIGEPDPVSELNSKLWNEGDRGQDIARKQKRKLSYISNIYVVKDPGNTANEGKVFLYRYGKKVFDKLNDKMAPSFEEEKPMNPFDLWEGANFKLKIQDVGGYRNYDKSEFAIPDALSKDDKALEAIWKTEYKLQPFVADDQFKPYKELKARLEKVLARPAYVENAEEAGEEDSGPGESNIEERVVGKKVVTEVTDDADETTNLKFFEDLAADDE